jgi:hypothetical protein
VGNKISCFPFDNRRKDRLGLSASRGVGSPEVHHVEEQKQSREMVGVRPRRCRSGRLAFTRGSGGDSFCAVGPQPRVGVVSCSCLVRSRDEEARALPKQLLGAAAGLSSAGAQVAEVQMMFVNRRWQRLNRDLWSSPREVIATVSGLIAIVGAVVAIVRWIAMATSVA